MTGPADPTPEAVRAPSIGSPLGDATPTPPAADATVVPPAALPAAPASPFARLRTNPGSVLVTAFDLLTRASADVRRGSFYVGLIALGTIGPVVVLLWGVEVASEVRSADVLGALVSGRVGEWLVVGEWLALGGLIVAFVESRGVAMSLLGARLEGRPFGLRDAVQRSRTVFWRVVAGIAIVNAPVLIAQKLIGDWLAGVFHGASEVTTLTPAILVAIAASPVAYVLCGIVLGDVGPIESVRRSVRLFSARRRSAVVVSLFALAAQYLTLFGALAGLDLIARVFDSLAIGPASGDVAVAIVTVVILAVVFAIGSLLFTVAAIAAAPQVVMFLALTHASPGLARVRGDLAAGEVPAPGRAASRGVRGFRWLTVPMRGAMALGLLVTVVGLVSLNR